MNPCNAQPLMADIIKRMILKFQVLRTNMNSVQRFIMSVKHQQDLNTVQWSFSSVYNLQVGNVFKMMPWT